MEAPTITSSSQVTVQCTDPNSLLETLKSHLAPRLPLRHLHWKAPSRPLRSIETLQVALIDDGLTDTANGGAVRRHQIAGLQQSPYIKLYLLRCDEKLQYKDSVRKELKQWVKTCNSVRESKSGLKLQEQYDAFEWLIVHVVLPDTPAASEPRSNKHLSVEEASDSTDSLPNKGSWTGKKTSTIYDKLRSDFGSSRATIERVAQIRIPGPAGTASGISPVEANEQWQDFVDKLKSLILKSFDSRVAQYELDIREREAQRTLPGWNFCTYFVLKESLARSFASVGLLEDSLATYNELTIELDTIVVAAASDADSEANAAVLSFSNDLKPIIRKAIGHLQQGESQQNGDLETILSLQQLLEADKSSYPFALDGKDYLNLILTNQVSVFDLRIYIFARVLEILRRQVTTPALPSTRTPNGLAGLQVTTSQKVDLAALVRIYDRGNRFVNLAARNLRQELYRAWGGQQGLDANELQTQQRVINGAVASWTWAATLQLLNMESSQVPYEADPEKLELPVEVGDSKIEQTKIQYMQDRSTAGSSESVSSQDTPQDIPYRTTSSKAAPVLAESTLAPERRSLWVAKLFLLMREVVTSLEPGRVRHAEGPLNHQSEHKINPGSPPRKHIRKTSHDTRLRRESLAAIESKSLALSAQSTKTFTKTYEMLSAAAFNHFVMARKLRSAKLVLLDLASLAFHQGHIKRATQYFDKVIDLRREDSSMDANTQALEVYLHCLYLLGRATDHVRCSIRYTGRRLQLTPPSIDSPSGADQKILDDMIASSRNADRITLPLADLLRIKHVDRHVHFLQESDSFNIALSVQLKFDADFFIDNPMTLKLRSIKDVEPSEIELTCNVSSPLRRKTCSLVFRSNLSTTGWYELYSLELITGNVLWLHHFQGISDKQDLEGTRPQSISQHAIHVYPVNTALRLSASVDRVIDLSQRRKLVFKLHHCSNKVDKCSIKIKAATAGLRVHLHETELQEENDYHPNLEIVTIDGVSLIELSGLKAEHDAEFSVPYSLEHAATTAVELKTVTICEGAGLKFTYYDCLTIKTILPVTVNVQDVFKSSCIYSKFTVSPATPVPLRLFGCQITNSADFEVASGPAFEQPLEIFTRQSGSWVVRLKQKLGRSPVPLSPRVQLVIEYECIDEQFLTALERRLEADLSTSPVAFATKLLCSHFTSQIQKIWTEQDLEIAALTRHAELWPYEQVEWQEGLQALSNHESAIVEAWLRDWHNSTVEIDITNARLPLRTLMLNVDLQTTPALVVMKYRLPFESGRIHSYSIGQPFPAELTLSLASNGAFGEKSSTGIEISFEVIPQMDTWSVGGRRKGTIEPSSTASRFQLILIPQKTGHLILPAVEVKCQKQTLSSTWVPVHVEVENQSHATTVPVSAGLRSSTIAMADDENIDSSNWLVDSTSISIEY